MSSRVTRVARRRTQARRHTPWHNPYPPMQTSWTHKFFCLSNVGTHTVPLSKGAKEALTSAGLGEKVLSLPSASRAADLHHLILETFPSLSSCGGYTLLKCIGKTKGLEVLNSPPGGHTPLSISAVVGQSRVYIRPLQQDIVLSPAVGETEV